MNQDPIQPDPGGRIAPGARVMVTRKNRAEAGTIIDNQGPEYLVRFGDGVEAWYDRVVVERENLDAGEWEQ